MAYSSAFHRTAAVNATLIGIGHRKSRARASSQEHGRPFTKRWRQRYATLPAIIGTKIHSAFVTLDATTTSGIRSIADTESFTARSRFIGRMGQSLRGR